MTEAKRPFPRNGSPYRLLTPPIPVIEGCDSRVWGRARRRAFFSPEPPSLRIFPLFYRWHGVSLLVRARCACRRLFQTEASLSMLSPRLASAAHPCTRPGCRLQHNRFPGQPCACVACLFASLLAQARGWYVPSGFSDCSAAVVRRHRRAKNGALPMHRS